MPKSMCSDLRVWGEMNPSQLRETTMQENTRRLVQMTIGMGDGINKVRDMLLAKKQVPCAQKMVGRERRSGHS